MTGEDDIKEKDSIMINYKENIVDMVKSINNQKFLKFLFELLKSFKEKWGI